MNMKPVRCTTCGTQMDIDVNNIQHTCKACGNTYIVDIAAELNNKKDFDSDKLQNLRTNLDRAISMNDLNSIEHLSREILIIIPEDFSGQYYNAYASSKLTNPKLLHKLLKGTNFKATTEEMKKVILHLANNMELRDRPLAMTFINNNCSWMNAAFTRIFLERVRLEDNYAVIDRDVFICHRSTDSRIVDEVVTNLELDGHTCWVSSRNLRPDDNQNYWNNIEEAIEHCSIFLVVSSQDAMLSKDVQKELRIALKLNIKKLEYKIDDSTHTSQFKHFFDGHKWINAIGRNNFTELNERVYQYKITPKEVKTEEPSIVKPTDNQPSNQTSNVDSLVKRMKFELSLGKVDVVKDIIQKILDLDVENEEAWTAQFFLQVNVKSEDEFKTKLSKANLNTLSKLKMNESFIALNKLNINHRFNTMIDAQIEVVGKKQKEEAFRKMDIHRFATLSDQFPDPNYDMFTRMLISNQINSYENLERMLQDLDNLDLLSPIFTLSEKSWYLDNPHISNYYQQFETLMNKQNAINKQVEEQKRQEQLKLEEEQFKYFKRIKNLLSANDFETVRGLMNESKKQYGKTYDYALCAICLMFEVPLLSGLKTKTLTLEEKIKFVDNPFIQRVIDNDKNKTLNQLFEQYNQEVNEHKEEQRIIQEKKNAKKKKRRRNIIIASVSSFLIVVFLIGMYQNMKVDINYDFNGVSEVDIENSISNQDLPYVLPDIEREGYTFNGWFDSEDPSANRIYEVTAGIFKDVNVYANWTINQYSISFNENEGSDVEDITQDFNSSFVIPEPVREGYTFTGWYRDQSFTNEFTETTVPASNVQVYARWMVDPHTITLSLDGGTGSSSIFEDYGTSLDTPSTSKEGYTFIGWYQDASLTVPYTFTTMPAEDITVYAKWSINQYTISFEENDGDTVTDITQDFATSVTEPTTTKVGYTFAGWYQDASFNNEYTFDTMPSSDITLYAKWLVDPHTITLMVNGDVLEDSIFEDYGTSIPTPTYSKEGYSFIGWYEDALLTIPFTFTTMPAEDITIYAKWSINQYTISFEENNGTVVPNITDDYAETVSEPVDPTRQYYIFDGWFTDETYSTEYSFTTMPSSDITVYAKWKGAQYSVSNNTVTIESYDGEASDVYIPIELSSIDEIVISPDAFKDNALITSIHFVYSNTSPLPSRQKGVSYPVNIDNTIIPVSIGDYAFYGMSNLTEITGLDNIVSIGEYAFANTPNLTNVNSTTMYEYDFGSKVETIGQYAFNQSSIKGFIGGASTLTEVDDYAFKGSNLERFNSQVIGEFVFPATMTRFGLNALDTTMNVTSLTVPFIGETTTEHTYIGHLFGGTNFNDNHQSAPASLTTITLLDVANPLGYGALYNTSQITTVNLGNAVTSIGDHALHGLSITALQIPNSVTTVGYNSLGGLTYLQELYIPSSVTSMGRAILNGASSLETLTIPFVGLSESEVTSSNRMFGIIFGDYANNTYSITQDGNTFYIPNTLTSLTINKGIIRDDALSNLTSITELVVLEDVTAIEEGALKGMSSLVEITLPFIGTTLDAHSGNQEMFGTIFGYYGTSATSGAVGQRYNSSTLYYYYIPETIESITITQEDTLGSGTFAGLTFVKRITIPETITSITSYAFYDTDLLISINSDINYEFNIPTGVTSIGVESFRSSGISNEIDLPNVTIIRESAFRDTPIESINADSLVTIEESAFQDSSLTRINGTFDGEFILPDTLTSIGDSAFKDIGLMIDYTAPFIGQTLDTHSGTNESFGAIFGYRGTISTTGTIGQRYTSTQVFYYYLPTTIESITITKEVQLGNGVFAGLDFVSEINIPDTITNIYPYTFYGNTSLSRLNSDVDGIYNLPTSTNRISDHAFYDNDSLSKLNNTEHIERVYDYAFYSSGLSGNIDFPEAILIGERAFTATSIIGMDIPIIVTIEEEAFYGATSLNKINSTTYGEFIFPDTLTSMGDGALRNVEIVKDITIPFIGTTLDTHNGTAESFGAIFGYQGTTTGTVGQRYTSTQMFYYDMPNTIETITITQESVLGNGVFANLDFVTEINIPDSITNIYPYSFYMNTSLSRLNSDTDGVFNLPSATTRISDHAFYDNNNLETMNNLDNIDRVYDFAFYSTGLSGNVDLPNTILIGERAFFSTDITSIDMPIVTTIEEEAFRLSISLTRVNGTFDGEFIFPETLTSMGDGALKSIGLITDITTPLIGSSLDTHSGTAESFGAIFGYQGTTTGTVGQRYTSTQMFYYDMPNTIETITITQESVLGNGVFANLDFVTEINIPDTITNIYPYSFYMNTSLARLNSDTDGVYNLPTSTTRISTSAFSSNTSLVTMNNMDSLTRIDDYALFNSGLSGIIDLPNVITIGDGSFYGTDITAINIPIVTTIEDDAFYNASNLVGVNSNNYGEFIIPDTVTSIGDGVFRNVGYIQHITLPFIGSSKDLSSGTAESFGSIFGYQGTSSGTLGQRYSSTQVFYYDIPTTIETITITGENIVGNGVFANLDFVTEITIPDNVYSIQNYAFYGNTSLVKLNSDTVGEFNLPTSTRYIYTSAFENNLQLTSLNNTENVEKVYANAFKGTSASGHVDFDSLTTIGDYAFQSTALTSIDMPIVVTIGEEAFYNTASLVRINSTTDGVFVLPDTLTIIEDGAFRNVGTITDITLPFIGETATSHSGYKEMFGHIFGYAGSTTTGTIGQRYQGAGLYYYYIPTTINSITITQENVLGNGVLGSMNFIETVHIPDTITNIEDYVFYGNTSMTSLNSDVVGEYILPTNVTTISQFAFTSTNIDTLIMQGAVKTVQDHAFYSATINTIEYGGYNNTNFSNITVGINNDAFNNATVTYFDGINYVYFNQNNITWVRQIADNYVLFDNGTTSVWVELLENDSGLYYALIPDGYGTSTVTFARFADDETTIDITTALASTNSPTTEIGETYVLQDWSTVN